MSSILIIAALYLFIGVGVMYMWAEVDPEEEENEQRYFKIIGTGWDEDDVKRQHLKTVHQGAFVWHVYEVFP